MSRSYASKNNWHLFSPSRTYFDEGVCDTSSRQLLPLQVMIGSERTGLCFRPSAFMRLLSDLSFLPPWHTERERERVDTLLKVTIQYELQSQSKSCNFDWTIVPLRLASLAASQSINPMAKIQCWAALVTTLKAIGKSEEEEQVEREREREREDHCTHWLHVDPSSGLPNSPPSAPGD